MPLFTCFNCLEIGPFFFFTKFGFKNYLDFFLLFQMTEKWLKLAWFQLGEKNAKENKLEFHFFLFVMRYKWNCVTSTKEKKTLRASFFLFVEIWSGVDLWIAMGVFSFIYFILCERKKNVRIKIYIWWAQIWVPCSF